MQKTSPLIPLLLASALAAGCQLGTGMRAPMPVAYPTTKPVESGGLTDLIKGQAAVENEISQNLSTAVRPEVPMRVALLYRGFEPTLKPEDEQAAIAAITQDLQASGLVKTVTVVPSSLVGPQDSLETMRKVASRFQSNVLILINGGTTVGLADEQPRGFFDAFSNQSNMEARTVLTALAVDVLSGRFLAPIEVVGKAGPKLANPEAGNFAEVRYSLQKEAETQALDTLKARFLDQAKALGGS